MKFMRKVYKHSHSASAGGWFFAQRVRVGKIENKEELRIRLNEASRKLNLIDVTAKIYDNIFFMFFAMKSTLATTQAIEEIQKNIAGIADWDSKYLFDGVYDVHKEYLKKYLAKTGFDFEKG